MGKEKTPSSPALPTPSLALALALPSGSLFAPYVEQLEGLAARHGVEKVADYVDKLDWQYRQQKKPPGKPIALLNKLLREGMITPEGYKTREQREAERKRQELQEAERKAEEARKREAAEALRQKDTQDQALWEALPEDLPGKQPVNHGKLRKGAFTMNPQQRNRLSEKVADLGNLAAAAMIFGQFISGKPLDFRAVLVGLGLIIGCYFVSYLLLKGE